MAMASLAETRDNDTGFHIRRTQHYVKRLAEQFQVDHLGSLPLNLSIREQADAGRPTVVAEPEGEIAALYRQVARTVAVKIAQKAKDFSAKFPTITVSKGT